MLEEKQIRGLIWFEVLIDSSALSQGLTGIAR